MQTDRAIYGSLYYKLTLVDIRVSSGCEKKVKTFDAKTLRRRENILRFWGWARRIKWLNQGGFAL